MLKRKIGMSCGLISILYVGQVLPNANFIINGVRVASAEESCTTTEECDEQINASQSRISAARTERDATTNALSEVEEDWSAVIVRIEATQAAIATLETQIEETKGSIQNQKKELAQLDDDVADLQELIGFRMRLAQRMNNSNDILEYITESETIVDFIRRVRIINHLAKTDAELMEELNTLIESQQKILTTLQTEQLDLTTKNQQLELERATLAVDQRELEGRMANLTQQIQASENTILDEEESLRIAEAQKEVLARVEIPKVVTNDNSSGRSSNDSGSSNESSSDSGGISNGNFNGDANATPTSSKFIHPMTSGLITCHWMCHPTHTGIDISHTNLSAPILAAAAGVVTTSGWHDAYGIWVIITHDINGERYSTLYAHLRDTPLVSVGDTVSQGQQIGIMGNTGNSTGPHLHFEIHPGGWGSGRAVDPRNYLDFPSTWSWF